MPETTPYLEIDALTKHFPVKQGRWDAKPAMLRAVDGVDLTIHTGETMGLVGESGCGKSTLAKLVVRLLSPTSGQIRLQGRPVFNGDAELARAFPRKVQMIFQDPFSSLNPRKRVGSSIGEALAVQRMGNRAERKRRVAQLLDQVGLPGHYARRYPHEFSGGQRQRIAIARALALNPDLVVCDEPVSALDVSIQAQVLNLLETLQTELDLTYLFISHDLSVVGHISDRVAVMYVGRIMELAPARELMRNPRNPYTRALLEAVPVPDPERALHAEPLAGDIPSPIEPPSGCPFHPRCPEAHRFGGRCSREAPPFAPAGPDRRSACWIDAA